MTTLGCVQESPIRCASMSVSCSAHVESLGKGVEELQEKCQYQLIILVPASP
jgi:hypothetical protein